MSATRPCPPNPVAPAVSVRPAHHRGFVDVELPPHSGPDGYFQLTALDAYYFGVAVIAAAVESQPTLSDILGASSPAVRSAFTDALRRHEARP